MYSPSKDCIYLPVINSHGLRGWQARFFNREGLKYLTVYKDTRDNYFGHQQRAGAGLCIIVEDLLSGWALQDADFASVSLLGTNLKDGVLDELVRFGYTEFVVWLDADNPIVRMKTRKIAKSLSLLGTVRVVETFTDPKEHSKSELRDILIT